MPASPTAVARRSRRRADPMPDWPALMLCSLVDRAFDDPNWIFEPKLDGLRVLARYDGERARLVSRNQKSQGKQFPDIVEAIEQDLAAPAILDGEIVCLDEHGRSSFRALQQRFHLENDAEIARRVQQYPAYLYVFDILYHDGADVRHFPLNERKKLLRKAVKWSDRVRWTEATPERGVALLSAACRDAEEGIIAKRLDSLYRDGRSDAWLKIKCVGRQEFVIGGFTDPQRSRVGLGALLVGYYTDDGRLMYAGKVGTGYTRQLLLDLRERLGQIEITANPFDPAGERPPRGAFVHWAKPELVAEIGFQEWTQNGLLRQPRFEGLRMDKKAKQVRREKPKSAGATKRASEKRSASKTDPDRGAARAASARPDASLKAYEEKRDFSRTPEPKPKIARSKGKPVFVVQEHDATRKHWDFRIESGGVLKSWAVTKQPSTDPADKRLAVQTEDHPLAYADFAGDIPKGEYGGGHMEIWDKGTFDNLSPDASLDEGLEKGKIEVDLHGKRLNGGYALIRMAGRGRGENWLLIKKKDGAARTGAGDRDGSAKSDGTAAARSGSRKASAAAVESAKPHATGKPERVAFTNTDRVMFPESGYTKGDLLRYYEGVADKLIPHLRDRPITLQRDPDGVGKGVPTFWQKNTPEHYPSWIPRVELPAERGGKTVNYLLVNDVEALLYVVNQGAITFHVGFSRVGDLRRPDFVLFDLDPGERSFADAMKVARQLRVRLEEQGPGVRPLVKTSGKSGIHVLVPWRNISGFDEAREWALTVANQVASDLPDLATTERSIEKRKGRLYVDVMQNAEGKHAVPPYVLRTTSAATVSTPLDWDELTAGLKPTKFDLESALKRFKRQRKDPFAPLLGS